MRILVVRDLKSFCSIVSGEYRVNGRVAKAEMYHEQLKARGILTKAHLGFLVFQVAASLKLTYH